MSHITDECSRNCLENVVPVIYIYNDMELEGYIFLVAKVSLTRHDKVSCSSILFLEIQTSNY